MREGIAYTSNIAEIEIAEQSIETIPVPTRTVNNKITPATLNSSTLCLFDLETTSVSDECDILQMSAVTLDRSRTFNEYILPTKLIDWGGHCGHWTKYEGRPTILSWTTDDDINDVGNFCAIFRMAC